MKNLHIQNTDKFIEPFIKFINKYFEQNNHRFAVLLRSNREEFESKHRNVVYIRKSFKSLIELIILMNKSTRIYLHGLFNRNVVILLFLQPWLLKKSVWIAWGGDLYRYRKERKKVKQKIYEFIRRVVIKNVGEIMPIVEGDYKLAQDWYGTKAKFHHTMRYTINLEIIHKFDQNRKTSSDKLKILVGNSATQTNYHYEVFDILKQYKYENIEIITPLSYGDNNYAKEVIKKGRDYFGDKFTPLLEFLKREEYIKLLSQVDVGIFNNDRQQAMGNILLLMYFGKKVYLRPGTTMWETLSNRYYLFSIKKIDGMNISELADFPIKEKDHNKAVQASMYDINEVIEHWKKVLSED